MYRKLSLLLVVVIMLTLVVDVNSHTVDAQDGGDEPQYAGLDMDLSGVTIRMANIGA